MGGGICEGRAFDLSDQTTAEYANELCKGVCSQPQAQFWSYTADVYTDIYLYCIQMAMNQKQVKDKLGHTPQKIVGKCCGRIATRRCHWYSIPAQVFYVTVTILLPIPRSGKSVILFVIRIEVFNNNGCGYLIRFVIFL